MVIEPPRGVRLANPGNIRISDVKWQGKVVPSNDPDFETFQSPEYGIRALAKILLSDGSKGINTVHSIISRYAPSSENNTKAYEDAVCRHLNVNPDDKLDLDDYKTLYALVGAIILHENGSIPYNEDTINKALTLAGVYNPPPLALSRQPETHMAIGATAIAGVSIIGQIASSIDALLPLMPYIERYSCYGVISIAVIGIFYGVYALYKRRSKGL